MKKIAIISSGNAPFAAGLVSLFNEGNRVRVVLALSDREGAPFLKEMLADGVESLSFPEDVWTDTPGVILKMLRDRGVDMIVVDGFDSPLPKLLIDSYSPNILSILPSLSPADSLGCADIVEVQRRVISDGATVAGAVVCRVDDPDCTGRIVDKSECQAGADAEALAERVSQLAASLLPRAIVNEIMQAQSRPKPQEVSSASNTVEKAEEGVAGSSESEEMASEPAEDVKEEPTGGAQLPPPLDRQWAEVLKMDYDPSKVNQPQPPFYPGMTPAGVNDQQSSQQPPLPKNYIVWSVLVTVLCCFVPGIVAIIFSSQVTSKYYSGDYEGARRASRNAEIWIIISFVLGVISSTLYLPFMLISGGFFG